MVTLPREVALYRRKWTLSAYILAALRLTAFGSMIAISAAAWGALSLTQCKQFGQFTAFAFTIEQALATFILTIRTAAIVDARRHQWKGFVLAASWLATIGTMATLAAFTKTAYTPSGNCIMVPTTSAFGLTYYAVFAFDAANVIWTTLTLYPLSAIKNGMQFYAVSCGINLLNAICFSLSDPGMKNLFAGSALVLSVVMAGRLILSQFDTVENGMVRSRLNALKHTSSDLQEHVDFEKSQRTLSSTPTFPSILIPMAPTLASHRIARSSSPRSSTNRSPSRIGALSPTPHTRGMSSSARAAPSFPTPEQHSDSPLREFEYWTANRY